MSDSDHDEEQHRKLLASVHKLDAANSKRRTKSGTSLATTSTVDDVVTVDSLLSSLSATNQTNVLKRSLHSKKRNKTLPTPLHKSAKQKIERQISYKNVRNELDKWDDVVKHNRLAEHLEFPLNQIPYQVKTTAERLDQCQPRTRLEIETAKLLEGSKNNLKHGQLLTEAEQELVKALSLSEAKQKLNELRRMRLLIGEQEKKFRRWRKIKSKQFHRRQKRQRHKHLLKEFDELKTKDPAAALEKLELLERDRIQERASLRHRGTGKWAKQLRQQARNNPTLRDALQTHLREGREMAHKQNVANDEDSSDDDSESGMELLSESDDDQQTKSRDAAIESQFLPEKLGSKSNPWLKANLAKLRAPKDAEGSSTAAPVAEEKPLVPFNDDWGVDIEDVADVSKANEVEDNISNDTKIEWKKKKTKRNKKKSDKATTDSDRKKSQTDTKSKPMGSIDDMFDSLQSKLIKATQATTRETDDLVIDDTDQVLASDLDDSDVDSEASSVILERLDRRRTLAEIEKAAVEEQSAPKKKLKRKDTKKGKKKTDGNDDGKGKTTESDVDPRKLLTADSAKPLLTVAPELIEQLDGAEESTQQQQQESTASDLLAEAFADDDVIGDFVSEKQQKVNAEQPKDIDLTLPGWGDWAGPDGQVSKRKRKRFTIKAAPAPPRRDRNLPNVIISEKADSSIRKLQVNELPFPFKSVADFEAHVRHPLGPEWNPYSTHMELTRPRVRTKAGTIIRPMNKQITFKEQKTHVISDSDSD